MKHTLLYAKDKGVLTMTELQKCLAGEYYNCHDRLFLDLKARTRRLLAAYNRLDYE